jgi:hypothetical protein
MATGTYFSGGYSINGYWWLLYYKLLSVIVNSPSFHDSLLLPPNATSSAMMIGIYEKVAKRRNVGCVQEGS